LTESLLKTGEAFRRTASYLANNEFRSAVFSTLGGIFMKRKFFALLTALCLLVCISLPAGATSPIDSSPANFVFEQISAIASI